MSQNRFTKDSSKTDPFVQQFFARIPPKTATTFTDAQLVALKQVFKERISKRHAVDIKLSMPFFKGFYIVLLLGKEKRSKKRLQAAICQPVNSILLTISGLVLITFLLGSLYIFKMTSGMNLFPNQEIQIKKSKSLPNI